VLDSGGDRPAAAGRRACGAFLVDGHPYVMAVVAVAAGLVRAHRRSFLSSRLRAMWSFQQLEGQEAST
jgi:hypothetical protein